MKKILLFLLAMFSSMVIVNAEDYYINENNVVLTKNEYDIISQIYWEGYQDIMTNENYQYLVDNEVFNSNIEISEKLDNVISTYSTVHETANKKIKIVKSCNNTQCTIFITLDWINMLKVRSYDVLGARFEGTSLNNDPITQVYLNNVKKNITMSTVKRNNGFGVSFKLPTGGSSLKITQSFNVSLGGTVYASYQHANKTSTLAKSKDYSINYNGYGGVFLFSSSSSKYYDAMGGVYI